MKQNLVHTVSINLRTRYLDLVNRDVTLGHSLAASVEAVKAIEANCLGCELFQICNPKANADRIGENSYHPVVEVGTDSI